jgi:protein PET100
MFPHLVSAPSIKDPRHDQNFSTQFGMYVMFPIGIMYYFGTNLDNRFSVNNFWPKPEECNKLPRDRDEVKAEYERIVARQRFRQAQLQEEQRQRALLQGNGNNGSDS